MPRVEIMVSSTAAEDMLSRTRKRLVNASLKTGFSERLHLTALKKQMAFSSLFLRTVSISGIDFFEPVKRWEFKPPFCSRDEALELEPELNPNLLSAVKVPDGAIDPFALVLENAKDAEEHGAKILLHTEITSLILEWG